MPTVDWEPTLTGTHCVEVIEPELGCCAKSGGLKASAAKRRNRNLLKRIFIERVPFEKTFLGVNPDALQLGVAGDGRSAALAVRNGDGHAARGVCIDVRDVRIPAEGHARAGCVIGGVGE